MNLETHLRAGGNLAGEPFGIDAGAVTRDVDGPVSLRTFVGFADLGAFLVHPHDDVVHDVAGAGQDFIGLDPAVFGQFCLHDVVSVRHEAGRLDVVGFAELNDHVGFADTPFSRIGTLERGLRRIA